MPNPIPTSSREIVARREMGRCFRCGAPTRTGEWHHRRRRGVRDEFTHSPCNGLWLCTTCHKQVHDQPFESRRYGWIVSASVSNPGTIPVKAHYGWLYLEPGGGFSYAVEAEAIDQAGNE